MGDDGCVRCGAIAISCIRPIEDSIGSRDRDQTMVLNVSNQFLLPALTPHVRLKCGVCLANPRNGVDDLVVVMVIMLATVVVMLAAMVIIVEAMVGMD